MSFFEELLKTLSSLFGKKETEQKTEQKQEQEYTPVPNPEDYVIPSGMRNELAMMKTSVKLTDAEYADLEKQIITMGNLGIVHYIIHTNGRGEPSVYYPDTGDRFWECGYLYKARTQAVFAGFNGCRKSDYEKKGMLPLLYETRLAEKQAGLPTGDVPASMAHQLELIQGAFTPLLTPMDISDLEYQIRMMRGKGITHYIIHSYGRNSFPQTDKYTGDRYWECNDTTLGTGLYGKERADFAGQENLFYENLL